MFWVGALVCLLLISLLVLGFCARLQARLQALAGSESTESSHPSGPTVPGRGFGSLLHRLGRRLEGLEHRVHRLQEQNRQRNDFVSQVSHELRTPLTSIRSFTEILLCHPEDADHRQEFLTIIREESERLTRLLDDLLDLAKIESQHAHFDLKLVSTNEIVRAAVASVQALASQRSIDIVIEGAEQSISVRGDRDKLMQVLVNLLSNALKFSDEGSTIRVQLAEAEAGEIHLSVLDSGAGIEAEDQERIFERFEQVRRPGLRRGTGLGLPICREIVHRHGGRIWVESELGRGSCFSFTLPRSEAPAEPPGLVSSRKAPYKVTS